MRAFLNNPELRKAYLSLGRDEINSIRPVDHEWRFGLPRCFVELIEALAKIEESTSKDFISAINAHLKEGVDYRPVYHHLAAWMLDDEAYGVLRNADNLEVVFAIKRIARLHKYAAKGQRPNNNQWHEAARDAHSCNGGIASLAALALATDNIPLAVDSALVLDANSASRTHREEFGFDEIARVAGSAYQKKYQAMKNVLIGLVESQNSKKEENTL